MNWRAAGIALLVVAPACGPANETTPAAVARPAVREMSLPDLSRMDPAVQEQVRERHGELTATLARAGATDHDRGMSYGRMAVLLHAAEYYDAAEPGYLNAQALMPSEPRWPYYLSFLYKSRGDTASSMTSLRRVLELMPDHVAALVWLGRAHLERGEVDQADALFARAQATAPNTVAALAGLGQTALARRDFTRAAATLEQALALDPAAASVHSPLAMAYRGLGDTARAEAHLKQWRNTEILVPDPMRQELDLALEGGLSYELRGVRALEARDFRTAAQFFTQGVERTPGTTALGRSLRHKLGTALYLSGDVAGAVKRFEETVRLGPKDALDESTAKAHYSLGVIRASEGRSREAIEHLGAAVRYSPAYVEALLVLADVLRLNGRSEEALRRYDEVLRLNPASAEARAGRALAQQQVEKEKAR
jgi:tetratricopeptide (TPR) repeat protein